MAILAFTLIAIAAVCGVLFWGMSQSKDIAEMGYSFINEVSDSSQDTLVMVNKHERMPVAACYTLLKENPELT